jgi:DNA-binding Lrp family transcriptional regulator
MSQLLLSQKEKEKIKNQYEEKIIALNNYIKNNIEKNKNKNSMSTSNSSKMFLPEMIPPELTYKIFMNCIRNFKYEEGIYKKYIKEDDLYIMKSFVEKMEKYIMVTSLPILKASKRKDYIVHTKANNESSAQKKYKEKILTSNKHTFMNKNMNTNNQKKRNISETKFDDRSNSMVGNNMNYNKYKVSLLSQKDI